MNNKTLWSGRFDGSEDQDLRMWQIVQEYRPDDNQVKRQDMNKKNNKSICFIGYNTDDGIRRNKGRIGAKDGSNAIRAALSSLSIINNIDIYDFGNLLEQHVDHMDLAQQEYITKVGMALTTTDLVIGLGGGHDIAYASFSGINNYLKTNKKNSNKKIGIINFDAHLDVRPYEEGGNSGTSFKQILDQHNNVKYAIVGFKSQSNTKRLIDYAKQHKVLILNEEQTARQMINQLKKFLQNIDILYISICMDVFSAHESPGVSAPTAIGMSAKRVRSILKEITSIKYPALIDIAEVSPPLDIDSRTSKLAASLIYEIIRLIK